MNHYNTGSIKATGKAREYVKAAMGIMNARGSMVWMIVNDLLDNRKAFLEAFREACQDAYSYDDKGRLLGSLRASLNNAYKVMNDGTGKPWLSTIPKYGVQVKKGKVVIGLAKERNSKKSGKLTKTLEKAAKDLTDGREYGDVLELFAKFCEAGNVDADTLREVADMMDMAD